MLWVWPSRPFFRVNSPSHGQPVSLQECLGEWCQRLNKSLGKYHPQPFPLPPSRSLCHRRKAVDNPGNFIAPCFNGRMKDPGNYRSVYQSSLCVWEDSHFGICSSPDSYPSVLKPFITTVNSYTVKTLHIQGYRTASLSLLSPSEDFISSQPLVQHQPSCWQDGVRSSKGLDAQH